MLLDIMACISLNRKCLLPISAFTRSSYAVSCITYINFGFSIIKCFQIVYNNQCPCVAVYFVKLFEELFLGIERRVLQD